MSISPVKAQSWNSPGTEYTYYSIGEKGSVVQWSITYDSNEVAHVSYEQVRVKGDSSLDHVLHMPSENVSYSTEGGEACDGIRYQFKKREGYSYFVYSMVDPGKEPIRLNTVNHLHLYCVCMDDNACCSLVPSTIETGGVKARRIARRHCKKLNRTKAFLIDTEDLEKQPEALFEESKSANVLIVFAKDVK